MKYKEKTDYAGVGVIPVPNTPLFTKNGFWVFWGDYTIVAGQNGAFPSLFVPWRDPTYGNRVTESLDIAASLLTQNAKVELGIVGLANQKPKP